jgi:hypothetical protein
MSSGDRCIQWSPAMAEDSDETRRLRRRIVAYTGAGLRSMN